MFAAVAITYVLLSLPVLAFIKVAHVPAPPKPNAIPDAEFDRLYRYARQEAELDLLAARFALFPVTEGRAYALEHIAIERAENLRRLLAAVTA